MDNGQWKNSFQFSIFNFQFRPQPVSGFTLVETLVVLVISSLIIAGGLAAYSRFNERQTIQSEGKKLYNDVRFTQSKAASSEKPARCGIGALEGYRLRFTSVQTYVIEAICGGQAVDLGITRTLATGVVSESQEMIDFRILGQGAQTKTFCLSGFDRFYELTVTPSGEVTNRGLVETCE